MNSSFKAFIQDLCNLAHKHLKTLNTKDVSEETFDELYEDEFMDDEEIMQMALEDAIRIGDTDEIAYIRQDIQRAKVKKRVKRKLNRENKKLIDMVKEY